MPLCLLTLPSPSLVVILDNYLTLPHLTHLPSNILLALIPLRAKLRRSRWCSGASRSRRWTSRLVRPTSSPFVDPEERVAAAAYTNTARYVVRPFGPLIVGPIITVSLGAPFVIAGGLRSVYDLCLYALFRHVKLPSSVD